METGNAREFLRGRLKHMLLICAAAFLLFVPCIGADTAFAGTVSVTDGESLAAAVKNAQSGDVVVVGNDITLTDVMEIPEGKRITLRGQSGSEKITAELSKSKLTAAQKSNETAMISVLGNLTAENLTFDAGGNLRTMSILKTGSCTLNNGAVITGGQLGKSSKVNGAGVMITGKNSKATASLTINRGSSISQNRAAGEQSVNGIGLYVGKYSSVVLNGGTIENNKDLTEKNSSYYSNGGGVAIDSYGYFVMNSGTVSNNHAAGNGGGIYQLAGVGGVKINGSAEISGNKTNTAGGGIYISAGEAEMNGGSIRNNTAETNNSEINDACGGGVYIAADSTTKALRGKFVLNQGTISQNTARSKAKTQKSQLQTGCGGGVMSCGDFVMRGGTIKNNTAAAQNTLNGTVACGGGVYVGGGVNNGTFELTGGALTGNTAGGRGGGIYDDNKTITTNAASIVNAEVYTPGNGEIKLRGNVTVKSNKGKSGADNVYLTEGNYIKVADSLAAGSVIYIAEKTGKKGSLIAVPCDGYSITNSDAGRFYSNSGKKIYNRNGEGNLVLGTEKSYKDFSKAEIGGAKESYIYTGAAICPDITVKISGKKLAENKDYVVTPVLNNDSYDSINVSTGNRTGAVKVIGIGDYSGDKIIKFKITPKNIASDDIVIEDIEDQIFFSQAKEAAPGISASGPCGMLAEGQDYALEYKNNRAVGTAAVHIAGKGNYSGTREITFRIVENSGGCRAVTAESELHTAVSGAGAGESIYILNDIDLSKTITVNKDVRLIGYNKAVVAAGAQMTNLLEVENGGKLYLSGLTLDAASKGRGLCVKQGASADVVNTVIKGGKALSGGTPAEYSGAGIYNEGELSLKHSRIESNTAKNGAGIYTAAAGKTTIAETNIAENTAALAGGGLYNLGTAVLDEGAAVTANKAKQAADAAHNGTGGGIYNGGKLHLAENSAVTENTADKLGAGIYTSSAVTMAGGRIENNCSETVLTNNIGNTPERRNNCGGGVYIQSGTFTMDGGSVSGNSVKSIFTSNDRSGSLGNGGGIFVNNSNAQDKAVFVMNGGTVANNTASSLMNNEFVGSGGGVYVMGGDNSSGEKDKVKPGELVLGGGEIVGNQATGNGGGVFLGNREFYIQSDISHKYYGAAKAEISGAAVVSGNKTNNLYMTKGVTLKLTGSVSGGNIAVTAEDGGEKIVAAGTGGYKASSADAAAFASDGARTVKQKNGNVILAAKDIAKNCKVTFKTTKYTYTGKEIKPTVIVKDKNGKTAKEGRDYKVSYSGTRINRGALIDAGTKRAIVTGIGDYSGKLEGKYQVVPRKISSAKVKLSRSTAAYTGKKIQPSVSSITYSGASLLRGSSGDYTVSYKNNIAPGKASVIFKGRGNFTGTKTVSFKIVPKKSAVTAVSSPKKKTLKMVWRKDAKASGYQAVIARDAKFTSGRKSYTVKSVNTVSKTVGGLSSGKYYYVKVRAYKTISGTKCYGAYSSSKRVKVK